MIEIAVPGAPAIAGLRFRHHRGEEDLPGMLRVYTAVHEHDGLEEVVTLDQLRLNYATVNCDQTRDLVLAEVDGEAVAYARRSSAWRARARESRSSSRRSARSPAPS